jgi:hypothetical protein
MSMAMRDLTGEVAELLNDAEKGFEFTRWTRPELIEYANDAVLQITAYRSAEFSATREVALQPGARQTLPQDATYFSRVVATLDQYGRQIAQPSATDTNATRIAATWFEPLACRAPGCDPDDSEAGGADGVYAIRSYAFDPDDQTAFYVDPPVPAGVTLNALVLCLNIPAPIGLEGALAIPATYHNAVIEWMLYRAYSKDTESATDATRAREHLSAFGALMGVAQTAYDHFVKKAAHAVRN